MECVSYNGVLTVHEIGISFAFGSYRYFP